MLFYSQSSKPILKLNNHYNIYSNYTLAILFCKQTSRPKSCQQQCVFSHRCGVFSSLNSRGCEAFPRRRLGATVQ